MSRAKIFFKALRELGPKQLGLYALYQIGLRSGYLRWRTRSGTKSTQPHTIQTDLISLPSQLSINAVLGDKGLARLLEQADEICAGQVRLFGGPAAPLELTPPEPLVHWTKYETSKTGGEELDVKWSWEAGRFGWAYTLARAYYLTGHENYAKTFWQNWEAFLDANPTNMGPQWVSAQEVALRLIAMGFCYQIFTTSEHTTPARRQRMATSLVAHARRIPPTLAYARAQNNNHLLTEAAGLLSAASWLPDHPAARRWRQLGWRWFIYGLENQIAPDGSYVQQSTNYHRLMLQISLWVAALLHGARRNNAASLPENPDLPVEYPPEILERLATATHWLLNLMDPTSGRAPNLGPNDGAYIQPLSVLAHDDFRPVLQAASILYLDRRPFRRGPWDEMALWLMNERAIQTPPAPKTDPREQAPGVLRLPGLDSWAYLRTAHFTQRPGHADLLHLDLWWQGLNVAVDAGTYLYNADPPWDNALAKAAVHNTLTVYDQDQMTRAGRFLYLDWAESAILSREQAQDGAWIRQIAEHDGYRHLGAIHRRSVSATHTGNWIVTDFLLPASLPVREERIFSLRLHWLVPDWSWDFDTDTLRLATPKGAILLCIKAGEPANGQAKETIDFQVARAGTLLYGEGNISPTRGWVSPTYGYKEAALSLTATLTGRLPLSLTSEWLLPPKA
ncbi:MAG: alginate lyase family protein [Anaerolineales bacterium]